MSWVRRLLRGSFRGVPFSLRAHDSTPGGRRVHVHEYPGRDDSYPEDLGEVTKEFELNAFVVGDDYAVRRELLVAACNAPGPGVLVHPYLGIRRVVCTGVDVAENSRQGRMASLTMRFVAAGANRQPLALVDTQAALTAAVAAAAQAVAGEFADRFAS